MGTQRELDFRFDENGHFTFFAENFTPTENPKGDFWRIQLDDGEIREIEAVSSEQRDFTVSTSGDTTTISYHGITDSLGRQHEIEMAVHIAKECGKLVFSCDLANHGEARINELQLPLIDVLEYPCKAQDEELFIPDGLGRRVLNPRAFCSRFHTEYMAADYKQTWVTASYPPSRGSQMHLSMPWVGLQCGKSYLYLDCESNEVPMVTFALGVSPRNTPSRFLISESRYPALENGETIHVGNGVLALFDGDWRDGADFYKAWSEKTWYTKKRTVPNWVKNMNGWQRIILKHQYGEIFFKYADLPRLYLEGKKYGIGTLLVFGWWKGRFDNNYPEYEADPALGGADGLNKAIAEVQKLGGRVLLYTNGNLIDVKTKFYRDIGKNICTKDIDENEYREHYCFGNGGTLLRNYGYKSFVTACHCTKEWQNRLIENGKLKLSFGADCIFFDQLSCCLKLCFDKSHPHGNRVDGEGQGRLDNIRAVMKILLGDKAMGSEWVTDRYVAEYDFTHGCGCGMYYTNTRELFPDIFRRTFPDAIISNRLAHDDRWDFKEHLNYAFVIGLIFDVSIYRGRVFGIEGLPAYAEHIKKLTDLREKYSAFFRDGRYESTFGEEIPEGVCANRFRNGDKSIYALFNKTADDITLTVKGKTVTVAAKDIAVVE